MEEPIDNFQETQGPKTIQEVLRDGYSIDFERIFNTSLQLFQVNLWTFVGYTAALMFILYVLSLIPMLGPFVSILVTPYLYSGYFYVIVKTHRNEPIEFMNFFEGFKDRYMDIILNWIILWALILPVSICLFVFGDISSFWGGNGYKLMIFFYPLFLLAVISLILFNYVFLLLENLNPWESVVTSVKFALKNYGQMLGLALALIVINILGGVLAFIGLLFTIPFTAWVLFVAYISIFEKPPYYEDSPNL